MKAAAKEVKETPLMKQYNEIKQKYPDACLLFRVGDFYETFGEDAVRASNILGIVLTKRGAGSERETALAGFPHHSLNTYLPKLVKAGLRVAVCDQLEDPKMTKTIVKRGVTELITPGVALNDEVLQAKSNNFLAALHFGKKLIGLSLLDASTGEYLTAQGTREYIDKLLQNFSPSEILVNKGCKTPFLEQFGTRFNAFYLEDWIFRPDYANEALTNHFKTTSLKGFGIEDLSEGIIAAGAVLYYLSETRHDRMPHINAISRIAEDRYVWMDRFTVRNLELFYSPNLNAVTLIGIIDRTLTPMGGRTLRRWLALPLKNRSEILERQKVVEVLVHEKLLLEKIRQELGAMGDLERLTAKVATGKVSPKELIALRNSLDSVAALKASAGESSKESLVQLASEMDECVQVRDRISATLQDEAPVSIAKGNAISPGVNAELDELRAISTSGKAFLDRIEKQESERTGISSLKIAFNNVFGYYIEVRNTHKDKVPAEWIRKQTLVNAERYITEELKEYEQKILGAEEKIQQLESRIFEALVMEVAGHIPVIQKNARLVARLDCLSAFACLARDNNYNKPEISESNVIDIKNGRHPVIEKMLPPGTPYVANDVFLDTDKQQVIMITGPNMSGKSAILRQTALIVLLAQTGSFVPADAAVLGITDSLFTRVGSSDNISMGESTFMVEMNETSSILNNLTERSLVLLDEIGRGTSTYDGISIAWAIAEYLHEHPGRPKTLFATHYHELNEMCEILERVRNFNVSVKELKDNVLFLRKLVEGGSEHSFGIHVAKMAGMPQTVVNKAQKLLKRLEKEHSADALQGNLVAEEMQLSFFNMNDPLLEEIKSEINGLDLNTLTPIEALMKLNEIQRMLKKKK